MNPKELQDLLKNPIFTGKEKVKAWDLYKNKSPESALIFIKNIQDIFSNLSYDHLLKTQAVPYKIWGEKYIDQEALSQMQGAARLPIAIAGALMPDAHSGYGLPIGGVLATDNAIIPYAVGVDIACRMMLTVYPIASDVLKNSNNPEYKLLYTSLLNNTIFGAGPSGIHDGKIEHPILNKENWQQSKLTQSLRQTAISQIGTSGTGNHFVEWGELEITNANNPFHLTVGNYLALLSHSGSRGVGYKIANYYTEIAMSRMDKLDPSVKHLAWLSLDHDTGREYWDAMHLAGEFASANHHIIHARIAKSAGLTAIATVENHHNFAWKEKIIVNGQEKDAIVHRKGATPADSGTLGIIPGTMADPGYLVIGKGNVESLNSASHGSGRQMARTKAKKTISPQQYKDYLIRNHIDLIGGGLDEAPQAYKSIEAVMNEQKDLVDVLGKFQPRIVRMAEEDSFKKKTMPKDVFEGE